MLDQFEWGWSKPLGVSRVGQLTLKFTNIRMVEFFD